MEALDPSLFIGSSREGLDAANALQAELDEICEPTVWTQGVFGATQGVLTDLLNVSERMDFAVLLLTGDDETSSRGATSTSPRDNVVFELGLFLGALGARRVFILTPRHASLKLPSDLAGITRLTYNGQRKDSNLRAAMGPAADEIRKRIEAVGLRTDRSLAPSASSAVRRGLSVVEEQSALDHELNAIETAAIAQGWRVRTRSSTAFRLVAKNGQRYSLTISTPAATRDRIRPFAAQLKAAGLRISSAVYEQP